MTRSSVPERALVVAAHPDDIDFGAAGTVARWTDQGAAVTYCIVTDGAAGGFDGKIPREKMAHIRRGEQQAAAEVVGVSDIAFLDYPDGQLEVSLELRRDITDVIRRVRPELVICPSPERWFLRVQASHPDHLATGEATLCAVYPDARNPFAFPELLEGGLEPHTVPEVWLMASPRADHFVDITDTVERKLTALGRHETQMPDFEATEKNVRQWTRMTAREAGFPEGASAEMFQVLDTA